MRGRYDPIKRFEAFRSVSKDELTLQLKAYEEKGDGEREGG